MPILRDRQVAAIDIITWLHSERARAEGRTTAMAIGTIRAAAAVPNVAVPVRDHFLSVEADEEFVRLILQFVSADRRLASTLQGGFLHSRGNRQLLFVLDEPIVDWMPANWTVEPARAQQSVRRTLPDEWAMRTRLDSDAVEAAMYAVRASPKKKPPVRSLWDHLAED